MKPVVPNIDIATDLNGLARLRNAARDHGGSPDTLRQVASQFEALFTQMVLKSMREASFGDDLFGSEQVDLYRDLYDQQIAILLAKRQGLGLADALVRQLGGARSAAAPAGATAPVDARTAAGAAYAGPADFVAALWPHVADAAHELGVAPEALVSVAALETGWGRSVMRHADGRPANNLFGIKADARWDGERVTVPTLEYVDGAAVRRSESFRAYRSAAESVADFARFVRDNPRYQSALQQGQDAHAFVHALADGGYATDPQYARKLDAILSGSALRGALAMFKDVQVSRAAEGREGPALKSPADRPIDV